MVNRLNYSEYKGKMVVVVDYRNLSGDAMAAEVAENTKRFVDNNRRAEMLIDITGAVANVAVVEAFKKAAEDVKPLLTKVAVIGVSGLQKVLLEGVNRVSNLGAKPFDSEIAAKDWLVG